MYSALALGLLYLELVVAGYTGAQYSESLGPVGDDCIPVECLDLELIYPVLSTSSAELTSRINIKLLTVKSLSNINHVLGNSDADVNAGILMLLMASFNAADKYDIDIISIFKSFAESRRC